MRISDWSSDVCSSDLRECTQRTHFPPRRRRPGRSDASACGRDDFPRQERHMSIDSPIRISLEQDGDYAFRVQFHDTDLLPLLTDESPPLGQDLGPNPSRMLLAAVANCLVASLRSEEPRLNSSHQ